MLIYVDINTYLHIRAQLSNIYVISLMIEIKFQLLKVENVSMPLVYCPTTLYVKGTL
jgi:hypothetical protein